ncbi:MAG: alpha-L-fucosidase [Bacteroidia bacterium]|nr:alpha-L-fucosidase [Bacteroidia bacterium]
MKKLLTSMMALVLVLNTYAQSKPDKMDWWKEAKFGLFIHWGVYSVPAGVYDGKDIAGIGEWIMNRGKIPTARYQAYAKEFNPIKYNPEAWVKMAKDAGMKYLVITSKHHDGFTLFETKASKWNIVDATPYGKDLLKPLAEACHKNGIRLGFYYSQAQDWNNPGGAASGGHWDKAQDGSMDEYIDKVAAPQVKEILSNYGQVDILWWDTPTDMNKERAEKFLPVIAKYPNLITNNRLGGGYNGDTETPEQFVPATGFPGRNWETCMTMNDTWGYKSKDDNWKSPQVIIQTLIDIVSKGGNYLLNVGPTSEGLVPQPSIERLAEVGKWMKINGEAIYGTTASPFSYLPWGRCTQKGNKLYLHVFEWPKDGKISVQLQNTITKAYLLSDPKKTLKVEKSKTKNTITLVGDAPDKIASVVVVELKGAPEVLPLPTSGKTATASSEKEGTSVKNLFDGNPKNKWQPAADDKDKWVEVDLGEEIAIGAFSVVEPWHPWNNQGQKIEVQYKSGDNWLVALTVMTNGTGHTASFVPVSARFFRLKIVEAKDPTLNEWILFRAD